MTKWRKMNSAPMDGTIILVGLWVKPNSKAWTELGLGGPLAPRWDQYVAFYDQRTERFESPDTEACTMIPRSSDDFDAWTVIPKPPHWGKK